MKIPLRLLPLAALLCGPLTPQSSTAATPGASVRPNVVVFLSDDSGWGDYSRNGNRDVRTPNIDAIARGGVTLDRFYVSPVCSPTRAEFLTGRYHPRTGVEGVSTGRERLNLDEKTIADSFKVAGYRTGAFGKWHNGTQWPYHPQARGFDEYYGHTSGHWGEYFDPPLERNGRLERASGYIVDVCTDEALRFIESNRTHPFFCYIPFTTPHSPWAAPAEDWARFKDKAITQQSATPAQDDTDITRIVLAMMENQDANVGRVLRKLEELGLTENTIVVYFADNGPNSWRWNGGMKGRKGSTDEGGVRSPLFLRWPAQIPQDSTVGGIAGAIDLLPTLTTLAGIPRVGDKPLDGRDLSAQLLGRAEPDPERRYFSTWNGRVSVRTPHHRLDAAGRLYDMLADPNQTTPIGSKFPEVAQRLSEAVAAWRLDVFGARAGHEGTPSGPASVDSRPLTVGYREFPNTWLPARDAEARGTIERSASAPNSSYFVNWTSPQDAVEWKVDVNTTGTYAVELLYTCPKADAGSTLELTFNGARLRGKVTPAWDPPLYTHQDTLPRPAAESRMKEFRPLQLGTIRLERGSGALTLRASAIPGRHVMDLRGMTLTLLPD